MLINRSGLIVNSQDKLFYHLFIVKGKMIVSNLLEIRQALSGIIDEVNKNVFFDLENCEEIDSTGIGLLSNIYKRVTANEGSMGLIRPSQKVLAILKETGLLNLMRIYASEDDVEALLDKM